MSRVSVKSLNNLGGVGRPTKWLNSAFLLLASLSWAQAQTPLHEVNRCVTVHQLEQVLTRLSKAKDEPSKAALLWGSMLYDGKLAEGTRPPLRLENSSRSAALVENGAPSTKALQIWWLATLGYTYIPPDFRKGVIVDYFNVIENGRHVRRPVYQAAGEEQVDRRRRLLKAELMALKTRPEEFVVYLFWQRDPKTASSDAEVAKIANRLASPWRAVAIGELSLRERLKGESGPWSALWDRIVKNPRPLAVEAMLTENRERLAKKRKG